MPDLAMSQLSGMWNLAAANGPNLLSRDRYDSGRLSRERYEFDLVGCLLRIDMNHRTNVTGFKPFIAKGSGQNDSIVFADHTSKVLERISRDQPWGFGSHVNNPDGSERRSAAIRTRNGAVNSILDSILGFGD
jgi:hypothetical protein